MSDYFRDRVVWITGASSGIGAACAEEFARRGAKVAISARDEKKLNALADKIGAAQCIAIPLDVTDRAANAHAVARIKAAWGRIDTAFLNAGTWQAMDLPNFDSASFKRTFDVNVLGIVHGIEAVLPELIANRGHLVGMSSSVAYRGIPRAESYCASKAAIRAMLQALRCQLLQRHVAVSIVMPGFVKSPLTDKNDFPMPFLMEVDDAAKVIANGVAKKKSEIAFPFPFIAMMKLMSWLPDSVYTSIMSKKMARS
ncbi:MAG: SDR family NAD(P)-dependent oxidoreductase [Candidatus Sumerlaeota bacterium]